MLYQRDFTIPNLVFVKPNCKKEFIQYYWLASRSKRERKGENTPYTLRRYRIAISKINNRKKYNLNNGGKYNSYSLLQTNSNLFKFCMGNGIEIIRLDFFQFKRIKKMRLFLKANCNQYFFKFKLFRLYQNPTFILKSKSPNEFIVHLQPCPNNNHRFTRK